jgi:hypothetical protein
MVALSLMAHVVMAQDVNAGKPQKKFEGPLKVYILAGQSNMEGHAAVSTFDYIGKDPLTAPLLKEMRNPNGTPRVCDKVWMSYLTGPYDGSANGAEGGITRCNLLKTVNLWHQSAYLHRLTRLCFLRPENFSGI